jgi:hypothetical protein
MSSRQRSAKEAVRAPRRSDTANPFAISSRHKGGTVADDPSSRLRRTRLARSGTGLPTNHARLTDASRTKRFKLGPLQLVLLRKTVSIGLMLFRISSMSAKISLTFISLRAGTITPASFPRRVIPIRSLRWPARPVPRALSRPCEQTMRRGGMAMLREPYLHIRPLLQMDAFHEAHLAGAQRQDH